MQKMPKSHNVMDFLKPYQNTTIFLSLCAFLCLISLVLLNQDLNPAKWESELADSGKVVTAHSYVRRKKSNSLIWNKLANNNHLFHKDSIQVGPESSATFELNNGETVELGPDSFFVLDLKSRIESQLKRGALVLSQNGERTLLESNADGSVTRKKLLVQLESPLNNAQFVLPLGKDSQEIEFDWIVQEDQEELQEVKIALSRNKTFTSLIFPKEGKYLLTEGTYFWRLQDEQEPVTEVRTFHISRLTPLTLVSPANGENIVRIDLGLPISFNWKPIKTQKFKEQLDKIIIAEDKEFKKIVLESIISQAAGFANIKLLKEGTYFWKLISQVEGTSAESEIRNFHLTQTENLSIKLLEPKENVVLRKSETLLFQWELTGVDAEAQVEVIDFGTRKNLFAQTTKGSALSWKDPVIGSHLWRVSAKNALKNIATSSWRVITILGGTPIKTFSPLPGLSKQFWEEMPVLSFEWEKFPSSNSYALDFSETPSFSKILLTQITTDSEIKSDKFKMPLGKLYWRVRAIDSEEQTINMSDAIELTYDHPPTLAAPTGFSPPEGSTWDVVKEGKDLLIQWEPVEFAKAYEVTIAGSNTSTFSTRVDKPELILKRYRSGKYNVSVAAVDVVGRIGQALGPVHLNVHYSPLRAPTAEEPEIK